MAPQWVNSIRKTLHRNTFPKNGNTSSTSPDHSSQPAPHHHHQYENFVIQRGAAGKGGANNGATGPLVLYRAHAKDGAKPSLEQLFDQAMYPNHSSTSLDSQHEWEDGTLTPTSSSANLAEYEDASSWPFPHVTEITVQIKPEISNDTEEVNRDLDEVPVSRELLRTKGISLDASQSSDMWQLIWDIQSHSANVIKECLSVKETLQMYDPSQSAKILSLEHLERISQTCKAQNESIESVFTLVCGFDTHYLKRFYDPRHDWYSLQKAFGDVEFVLSQPSHIVKKYKVLLAISKIIYVIDDMINGLNEALYAVLDPHWKPPCFGGAEFYASLQRATARLEESGLLGIEAEAAPFITGDVFHFSVVASGSKPRYTLAPIKFSAAATPGSIDRGKLKVKAIRAFLAQELHAHSHDFEIWCGPELLESGTSYPLTSWTQNHLVVVQDPVINVVVSKTGLIELNISRHLFNKAYLTVGQVRTSVRNILEPQSTEHKELLLFMNGHLMEPEQDYLSLLATGHVNEIQIEGQQHITIRADYNPKRIDCIICADDKYIYHLPCKITSKCEHTGHVCIECLRHWLDQGMTDSGTDLFCPECPRESRKTMAYDDIKKWATQAQFDQYNHLTLVLALSNDPAFHWCNNEGCTSGQLQFDPDDPKFTCASCNFQWCLYHDIPWHVKETCQQYDEGAHYAVVRRQEELDLEALIAKVTRQCPRCKIPIQKNEGCDHMTCRTRSGRGGCGYQFCFECGADFEKTSRDAMEHDKDCKYYHAWNRNAIR